MCRYSSSSSFAPVYQCGLLAVGASDQVMRLQRVLIASQNLKSVP